MTIVAATIVSATLISSKMATHAIAPNNKKTWCTENVGRKDGLSREKKAWTGSSASLSSEAVRIPARLRADKSTDRSIPASRMCGSVHLPKPLLHRTWSLPVAPVPGPPRLQKARGQAVLLPATPVSPTRYDRQGPMISQRTTSCSNSA